MAKNENDNSLLANQLKSGTVIEGDIKTNGDIRIDGTVIGTVEVKGRLVLGATGNIEGEIVCQNAEISGTIKGKIVVHELLTLKSTTKLSGDIVTNKLAIEPGAQFSGGCSMGGVVKDIKYAGDTQFAEKTA